MDLETLIRKLVEIRDEVGNLPVTVLDSTLTEETTVDRIEFYNGDDGGIPAVFIVVEPK